MLTAIVKGGTRAGRRTIKERGGHWTCVCGCDNPGFRLNCGDCRVRREV